MLRENMYESQGMFSITAVISFSRKIISSGFKGPYTLDRCTIGRWDSAADSRLLTQLVFKY